MESIQWYIDRRLVHEIHTSERKSFRGCRRRWDWIFRHNYYPFMTPKHFDFGTAFHVAKEVLYDPATYNWPIEVRLEAAIRAFIDKNAKQKAKFLAHHDLQILDEEVEADFQERQELGIGMLRYFCNHIAPKYDHLWRPLKVEVEFMVPIPHPHTKELMWCKCDSCWEKWLKAEPTGTLQHLSQGDLDIRRAHSWKGLPVVYAGRLDALGEDERGDLWVIDWKTAAQIRDDSQGFLDLDDQVGSYPWALDRMGIPVRGFIHHQQRKGVPAPPTKNKNQRLGRWFSVNRQQVTEYDLYLETVKSEDPEAYEAGLYDDYLEFLKNDGIIYFDRRWIPKTPEELDQIEYNIGLEALEMISDTIATYPNPGRFSCDSCAFREPCIEKNRGGDYVWGLNTLFDRREHYYIREEPSTDKKSAE